MDIAARAAQARPYRTLLTHYLLPYWRLSAALLVLLLAGIGLELANPQILRHFIDSARGGASLGTLTSIAVLFLAIAIATQIFSVAETYVAENLGWLATNRLRADLALHCLQLDPSFLNAHTPGELIERIDGDVSAISNFFARFVVRVAGNVLLLLGVLILLYTIDWRVGLAMTVFTAAAIVVAHRLRDIAAPQWNAARQASAELIGFIEERLAGTEDIRSSGAVAYVMRRFYERARAFLRATQRASVVGSMLAWATILFFTLGTAVALGLGAWLFSGGLITLGTVYLIFNYSQMLNQPVEEITRQLADFQQAAAGMQRVQRLLDVRSAIADGPGTPIPRAALSVELCNVTFAYGGDEPVLRAVSFALRPGEVLGLLGRTGSGKTTISRLLFRLYDPQGGSVRLGGVDLRESRLADVRRAVGMVTQDIQLFHASVRDNLTFFDGSIPDERIEEVLADLGLWSWVRSLPRGLDTLLASGSGGLSAGEAQLLAFARVFLKDPGLVILDEASSRLDPATERQIEHAVDRLLAGRTGLVIAHRLGTVRRADQILILDEGRVLEYGSRETLAADPTSYFAHRLRIGLEEVLA
jgi:ATP-binding cassette subfamily B protein